MTVGATLSVVGAIILIFELLTRDRFHSSLPGITAGALLILLGEYISTYH